MRSEEETFSRASRALGSEITAPLNRNRNLVKFLKMKDLPKLPSLTDLPNLPDLSGSRTYRYDLSNFQTSSSKDVEETVNIPRYVLKINLVLDYSTSNNRQFCEIDGYFYAFVVSTYFELI